MTNSARFAADDPPRTGDGQRVPDPPVRAVERRRLATELHDIVAHHLSNVALRTMGRLDLTDLVTLQAVLDDVNVATGSALVELRLLAHVLDVDSAIEPDGIDAVDPLSRRPAPTVAAGQWQTRMSQAGRVAVFTVPEAADHLAMSVQTTITRTFDATSGATLRFAGADARATTTVLLRAVDVTVLHATTLSATGPLPYEALNAALRGLRERVDLTHGRLTDGLRGAASRQPEWVVTVALPLD